MSSSAPSSPPEKLRNVKFTWNNPPEDCLTIEGNDDPPVGRIEFDPTTMQYLVYQLEQGESGTFHYEGYLELKTRTRFRQVQIILAGDLATQVHLETRYGTQQQCIEYCTKNDETYRAGPWEGGTPKDTNPGQRNDLLAFKDAVVEDRKRKRDLVDDHYKVLARHHRFYETLTEMTRPTSDRDLRVFLLYGPPGSGKSRAIYHKYRDELDELWVAPVSNGTVWFDSYDRHRFVLLDDFAGAGSHITLTTLLQLVDRYTCRVPIKGGHTWFCPERIYITTNVMPSLWYKWEGREIHYRALSRRFHCVLEFEDVFDAELSIPIERDQDWWRTNGPSGCLWPPQEWVNVITEQQVEETNTLLSKFD